MLHLKKINMLRDIFSLYLMSLQGQKSFYPVASKESPFMSSCNFQA